MTSALGKQELDGYTYLGFFRMLFAHDTYCRACREDAVGVLVVIGRGNVYSFAICAPCGQMLDERLTTHGIRKPIPRPRRIAPERRRQIAETQGSMRSVARLFDVDPTTVKECRRERSPRT